MLLFKTAINQRAFNYEEFERTPSLRIFFASAKRLNRKNETDEWRISVTRGKKKPVLLISFASTRGNVCLVTKTSNRFFHLSIRALVCRARRPSIKLFSNRCLGLHSSYLSVRDKDIPDDRRVSVNRVILDCLLKARTVDVWSMRSSLRRDFTSGSRIDRVITKHKYVWNIVDLSCISIAH